MTAPEAPRTLSPSERDRLEAALARRRAWPGRDRPSCLRLVDGTGDDLPGLIVEQWGPVVRVETYDEDWRRAALDVAEAVVAGWPGITAAAAAHRPPGGESSSTSVLFGEVPPGLVVVEDGLRYLVRLVSDAVGLGLFLDQRRSRALVRQRAEGGPALNLFAHAGGFGVAAAAGGASRVDQVDAARKCSHWASLNLALNGHDPRRHRFLVEDAFRVLLRAEERGPAYQVIVCDPPTTARLPSRGRRPGGRFVAREVLPDLAAQCCAALLPGGWVLLSCNDRRLVQADLDEALRRGARDAGRSLVAVEPLELDDDFTARAPQHRSTKGVWGQVGG